MLEALLVLLIIGILRNYFYKKSPEYKKDMELKKQDDIENHNLEVFIDILENKKQL